MMDDYLSDDLKRQLDAAAELIRATKNPEGTLVAAYDYLENAVHMSEQTQRPTILLLRLFEPSGGNNAANNSQGQSPKEPVSTPYDDWSEAEKDAFPKKDGNPDPSYMMLHLGSWCWYTSAGKKCY